MLLHEHLLSSHLPGNLSKLSICRPQLDTFQTLLLWCLSLFAESWHDRKASRPRTTERGRGSKQETAMWANREIKRQTERILLYPGAHDALVCWGPFGGVQGVSGPKSLDPLLTCFDTHTSAHTHPHIKQPIPPTRTQLKTALPDLCVCVSVWERPTWRLPVYWCHNILFKFAYSQ